MSRPEGWVKETDPGLKVVPRENIKKRVQEQLKTLIYVLRNAVTH